MTILVLKELSWGIIFHELAISKNHYSIVVYYGLQSVGDRYHSAFFEFGTYHFLDLLLGHEVYIGGGFVKDHDFVLAKDGSANA